LFHFVSFCFAGGVAVDGSGGVVVTDMNNHRLRLIGADNIVSTLAGTDTHGHKDGPAGDQFTRISI
jgi:hypothetical protein